MDGLFLTFLLSGLGAVIVLWHKVWELKRGASLLPHAVREKGDALIHKTFVVRFRSARAATVTASRVGLQNTKKYSRGIAVLALHHIHNYSLTLLNKLKGKSARRPKGDASTGPASFFMQGMAEYKEKLRGERVNKTQGESDERI